MAISVVTLRDGGGGKWNCQRGAWGWHLQRNS